MTKKPTYEELEQQIEELEKKSAECKKMEEAPAVSGRIGKY